MIYCIQRLKDIYSGKNNKWPYIRLYRYVYFNELESYYITPQSICVSPWIVGALDIRENNIVSVYMNMPNGKFSRLRDKLLRRVKSPIPPDMCLVAGKKRSIFSLISNVSIVPSKEYPYCAKYARKICYSKKERREQAIRILRELKKIPGLILSDASKKFLIEKKIFGPDVLLEFWLPDNSDTRPLPDRIFRALAHEDCREDIFEALSEENKIIASLFLHCNPNISISPCYDKKTLLNELKNKFESLKNKLSGDAWIFAALLFDQELYAINPTHFQSQLALFFSRTSKTKSIFTDDKWVEAANRFHRLLTRQTEKAVSKTISQKTLPLYKKLEFLTPPKSFERFSTPEYLAALMSKEEFLTLAQEKLCNKKNKKAKFQVLRCLEVFEIPVDNVLDRKKLSDLILSAALHSKNPDVLKPLVKHKEFIDVWLTLIAHKRCPQYARYISIARFSLPSDRIEQLIQNSDFLARELVYQLQVLLTLQDALRANSLWALKDKIAACTREDLIQAARDGIEDFAKASPHFPAAAHVCFYVFLTSGQYEYASNMLSNGFTLNYDTLEENAFKICPNKRVHAEETVNMLFDKGKISKPERKEMVRQLDQQSACYDRQAPGRSTINTPFWSSPNSPTPPPSSFDRPLRLGF